MLRSFIARVALAGLAGMLLFVVSGPGADQAGDWFFSVVYADCSSGDCWPPPPPSNGGGGGGGGGCNGCIYDSSCYSSGACIKTCSDPAERQKCMSRRWMSCNIC